MSEELRQKLGDKIVEETAPIIETMESHYPEKTIALAVATKAMAIIRENVVTTLTVQAAIETARKRYGAWDYLQTLGSAIERDQAGEQAYEALGRYVAKVLDIDVEDMIREPT
jgi:hypothetical protein